MRIAILGTGRLGHAVAEACCVRQMDVTVWNRTPERAVDLAEKGAKLASSAAEAVKAADTIICVVVSEKAIMEVLSSLTTDHPLHKKAWVNLTSTPSAGALRVQAATKEAGCEGFADVATSSASTEVVGGSAKFLLGCSSNDVERWSTFFGTFGTVSYTGDVGSASAFEIAHALPLFMAHHAYLEACALLHRLGLNAVEFWKIFTPPSLVSSPLFQIFHDYIGRSDFTPAMMTVGHYAHALRMILEELELVGANTVAWKSALKCAEQAAARGADRDWSCVYEIMIE